MNKLFNYLAVPLFALTIFGCGGGGGGGGSGGASGGNTGPVASANTFPFATMNANMINNGYSLSGTISGALALNGNNYPLTGAYSLSVSAATAATFEGQASLVQTGTITGSETLNNQTFSINGTSLSYSTTNYAPLGSSDGSSYEVMQGTAIIPATVKVGDTAQVGTYTMYADSTKAAIVGTDKASYVIEADTASTAIVNLVSQQYDTGGTLTQTTQERWRIDAGGNPTFVSVTASGPILSGPYAGGILSYTVH